ncbi:leucyl aminopeptidase [Rhodocaloribacter litoris]|uniref:leucyl aminopeptidase n=1 Tax=Rhodocaloribacter litoris TaxID=2558931 RepID=UPI00141E8909|nr:leucyl aminopeptidase [Rhodocaloribacter litoris]QXD15658.1 leucyl aminopeptidase [Rhodocaloribacter litoris]GIV61590.1 MAG: putative cytosol aminopeptidase [Rhodothermaceae bacterium]
MKISVTTIPLRELDVDLLIVLVPEDGVEAALATFREVLDPVVARSAADVSGALESGVLLYPEQARARRLALVGMGPAAAVTAEHLRRASAAGVDFAEKVKAETVGLAVPEADLAGRLDAEVASQALVEGFMLAAYRFRRYKTEENAWAGPQRLVVHSAGEDKACRRGAERARILAESVYTARDLVNLSPHEKTPTLLARAIERSAKKYGYEADVWDKALIEQEGMGGLLAVNRGSTEPPTFTVMTWRPEQAVNDRPVVLVGKGVVFDTGGLSLKPTEGSMEFMKSDMAGAAAVVGVMEALARLELPLYVVGLIPATDNRPGENAYVPGEVVRMHSGKTVEVLNTDAEGRMILADALSYARTYRPELVIDLATLTGAAVVALGDVCAAVMTNEGEGASERLARMQAAGERSGERVHPLPMFEDYDRLLESPVADLKNIGGRAAGSITAAKFLEHFVAYPWIHLDIAGPSFLKEAKPYRPRGGTGFGVRLLVEFLRDYARPRKR